MIKRKVNYPRVYVLIVSHNHGNNVSVHLTNEGAQTELHKYVKENWNLERSYNGMTPEDAIAAYFEENGYCENAYVEGPRRIEK